MARDIRVSRGSNIRVPHTIEDILCSKPLSILPLPMHFFSHQQDVSLTFGGTANIFAFLTTSNLFSIMFFLFHIELRQVIQNIIPLGDFWLWYLLYHLAISADACTCNFAGLEYFLHLSVMSGVIMQIMYCLMNIFIRHPRVSIFLPILDGMVAGAVTPVY